MSFLVISRNRLHQALQLAVLDLEEGHAPDPFRYSDYNLDHPSFLDRIEVNLRKGLLRPCLPLELSFPKSEFAIRPGRRIEIEDLTIVYYCILAIADDIEDKLKPGVTAYRVRRGRSPRVSQARTLILPKYLRKRLRIIEPWYNAWPSFIRSLRRDFKKFGRKFVGTSDITSFYEDVDLGLLRSELWMRVKKKNRLLVNVLVEMYQSWSARDVHLRRQNRGLPQGTNSSGVIANYYLMSFDDSLSGYAKSHNLRWYRYNDDMRLLGASRDDVKNGLRLVGRQLSRVNLIQQGSKTRILNPSDARKELFENRAEKIDKLIRKIHKSAPILPASRRRIQQHLNKYLVSVTSLDDKRDSAVLAILYRAYGELLSDVMLKRWKKDYIREPTRARNILSYVARFLNRSTRCEDLANVLAEQKSRATDWELAQFVKYARRFRYLPISARKTFYSIAQSKTANRYVRQQAVLSIGWFRLSAEARALSRVLFTEWDDEVRRSIVTCLFLLPSNDELDLILRASRDQAQKVSRMANYLLMLRKDSTLALATLRQFSNPNEVFFSENFWKLYQIRYNADRSVKQKFAKITTVSSAELTGHFSQSHMNILMPQKQH